MRFIFTLAVASLCLTGCGNGTAPQTSFGSFNAHEAAYIKKQGEATIAGLAFWRRDDGGSVVAAGETIRLVPATSYARTRFETLYRGKQWLAVGEIPNVAPDPQYAAYTRTARANLDGKFEFRHVPDGEYYVTAQTFYENLDSKGKKAGGAMFTPVMVTGSITVPSSIIVSNGQ